MTRKETSREDDSAKGRRRWRIVLPTLVALVLIAALIYALAPDYRAAAKECGNSIGTLVLDRNDRVLRILPDGQGRFALWRNLSEFPECLRNAVIAAEDKRFAYHPGFDPIAIVRAAITNIRRGRTVSGASTISQQVVRLINPRPRTYVSKIVELVLSLKLEWLLTKDEILELYLNLSPMGGNVRGAGLAAMRYFDKDVSRINVAEAAVLAALPRSPSRYDPRWPKGRALALAEKDKILQRMGDEGMISHEALAAALGDTVKFKITRFPNNAPHFVDFVMDRAPIPGAVVKTTLDLDLQKAVERIAVSHRERLGRMGVAQVGVMIASKEGPVLVMMGSLGYGLRDEGYNNACLALRGAGSTLKPFLYALALEKGFASSSEIPDTFRSYRTPHGDYLPLNADRRFYGPVSVRSALGNSLNITAVKVAREVGVENFHNLLTQLRLVGPETLSAEHYGLGEAIGNLEVTLYRLVQAYGALEEEGEFRPLHYLKGRPRAPFRVFSRESAYVISNILSDPSARLLTFGNPRWFDFGFPVAVKTGTSSHYRDCWAMGYTPSHVVGVWAGNFNGRPNNGYGGSAVCGPILNEIVDLLYRGRSPGTFRKPRGVHEKRICSMSGKLATAGCPYQTTELFLAGGADSQETCDMKHDAGDLHYLDASYAQWIDRREMRIGPGRFRLMAPPADLSGPQPGSPVPRPETGLHGARARIEILSPHDSDRFVMSPHVSNKILLRASPHPVAPYVTWLVDGREIAKTPPPYEMFWPLTRGEHVVHALTPDRVAARVTIYVE